jgi:hypothetical protein
MQAGKKSMQEQVKKEQITSCICKQRLERLEQKLMSIERELAELALVPEAPGEYTEPLLQRSPHKQSFYSQKPSKSSASRITKTVIGVVVGGMLLLGYATFMVT